MGSTRYDLHMLFFPFMAQGHMLPMVDMAKLFAARGAAVTILTTPANATLIRPTLDLANSSNPTCSVRLHIIPFPSAAAGLPDGCENRITLPSESYHSNFYCAVAMLREPFDGVLRDLRPDCVVTDMFMPWTYNVASARGIPRLLFDGSGFFSLCGQDAFARHRPLDALPPGTASPFVQPGLPHTIKMLPSQFPDFMRRIPGQVPMTAFDEINDQRKNVDPKSYGVVVNSFYELEPDYVDHYRSVVGRKAWHVGPVALCNQSPGEKSSRGGGRGNGASGDGYMEWLDGMKHSSVLYVCFGSAVTFIGAQLREMALGLEAAGHPFIWVVRGAASGEEWMPHGFKDRIGGNGMVIWGWAQQLLILNHPAVGGFMTHCGWNSIMEGISAGLPMVTWPVFAEQFYNERLLVDVVKVGVAVGSEVYAMTAEERPVLGAVAVEAAVSAVMGKGEEAEGRRRRARELGVKAKRAVEKGGSSYEDVDNLMRELLERKAKINTGGELEGT